MRMNKPLTIARQEFTENIVEVINNSELPFFVVSDILKNALVEVDKMAQAQYQRDKDSWEKSQEEEKAE